jgi:alanine-synthesizing transaminase
MPSNYSLWSDSNICIFERMFSDIASKLHSEANSLYRLRDEMKRQGHTVRDLISGNVNEIGLKFPQELLEKILLHASRRCSVYRPDSFGQRPAREAVSEYYRNCGIRLDPDRILITPGTSMAYWYCFKLLANEGDEILCPRPSYPLFDYIALLSGVNLTSYHLDEAHNWAIDLDHLETCISTRTRALVLISPHNPTGHVSSQDEIEGLAEIALRHNLPIICDEVFSEFLFQESFLPRIAAAHAPLVITLNGFSKMFALPGVKFGWMAVSGEPDKVAQAMRALELISDTFLPVSEIIQAAAPEIFEKGNSFKSEYVQQVRSCWKSMEGLLARHGSVRFVPPGGGFYITLNLGDLIEETATETILKENHILVHPGYFYDMNPNHLVLSFAQDSSAFDNSISELLATIDRLQERLTKND